jgi:hypothetical protein
LGPQKEPEIIVFSYFGIKYSKIFYYFKSICPLILQILSLPPGSRTGFPESLATLGPIRGRGPPQVGGVAKRRFREAGPAAEEEENK